MIKNERQYRVTKNQVLKFYDSLKKFRSESEDSTVHPILRKAQEDALKSQVNDLEEQLKEYEQLRSAEFKHVKVNSFDDLFLPLIKGRIAKGLSQKALADLIGIKEQQIRRYEKDNYATASIARVSRIADVLGLKIRADCYWDHAVD